MEELSDILHKIKVSTNELSSRSIQEVLLVAKKKSKSEANTTFWNNIVETLWTHLQLEFKTFDDQLLCATCFYTVLTLTDKKNFYLDKVLCIINYELDLKESNHQERSKTSKAVCFMYGMFQSAFLTNKNVENISNLTAVLQSTIQLLIKMAYDYSRFTFIVFKTINSFKKVCGLEVQDIIFSHRNQFKLLNLVNHNWENPITGVRDLNKDIFSTLISVLDDETYEIMLAEVNRFYWNKAKYLMLSVIIEHGKEKIIDSRYKDNWTDGLLNSLHKPGLVSAGADMYFVVLNCFKSEEEWCQTFLDNVIKLLKGTSNKAIENFNNYWFLITLKKFPSLIKIILYELEEMKDSNQKTYSVLSVTKQANKLGLVRKNWNLPTNLEIEKSVLIGLEHCNGHIRMLAFNILCVSKEKSLPSNLEYKLVLDFLHDNLNSDCTVLRLSMLDSFSLFIKQMHMSYINNLNSAQDYDLENLKLFCKHFQNLILSSLNLNGNYQRKITTIKILHIFLNNLAEVPKKRQNQKLQCNTTVLNLMKDEVEWIILEEQYCTKLINLLNDPAEDIRENVIELLLRHYLTEVRKPRIINHLVESAMKNMKSKYFYEINCGKSMFKLISIILLEDHHSETMFKNIDNLFLYAYTELVCEYKLNRNIVETIENGKQFHSFISILQLVLQIAIKNSYELAISNTNILELLDILEDISNQFAWEKASSTSSDFSKLSDMVDSVIQQSGYCNIPGVDYVEISGLHQIVLNSLWLNVKTSCELATILIQYQKLDGQIDVCEKCLNIIIHVLESCRHKGAIEAAGIELGKCIRYLTALTEDSNKYKLPDMLLKRKLKNLISESNEMSSVTRRGAGLSIMVHRIVSNDTKNGKPLFHCLMESLLGACKIAANEPKHFHKDLQKDLPKAILIHFLTRIVTDSSLATDTMYYSVDLAELAFENLTSSQWQIRNAALQLYGALIPKLIGQRKAPGTDEEITATVACDELRTHSPKLWKFFRSQLDNNVYTDKVKYHSDLVPVLNILANIARRYNFECDTMEQKEVDNSLLRSLVRLLDSPIFTVRRLTAKCIFNIYSFEKVYNIIIKSDSVSENFLHGILILTSYNHRLFFHTDLYKNQFTELKLKFSKVLNDGYHSYLCKSLFEKMFYDNFFDLEMLKQTFCELDANIHTPGVFLWANIRIKACVSEASWNIIPDILNIILDHKDFEDCCEILLVRLKKDTTIPIDTLLDITNMLMKFENKYNSGIVWKIIFEISLRIELNKYVDMTDIFEFMKGKRLSHKLRYILPIMAKICKCRGYEVYMSSTLQTIFDLTNVETTDVDMRYIAAMANNEMSINIKHLPDSIKVIAIKSAVILLQDEDEDIRNLSVKFYENLNNVAVTPHPYICLQRIMNQHVLNTLMHQSTVQELREHLDFFSNNLLSITNDEFNPFANDSKNIYLEKEVLKQLCVSLKN